MSERYSQRTVALAAEAVSRLRDGDMRLIMERHLPVGEPFAFERYDNRQANAAKALRTIRNAAAKGGMPANWEDQFVEDVAETCFPDYDPVAEEKQPEGKSPFLRSLNADGFNVDHGRIVPLLSTKMSPAKEESILEQKLGNHAWTTARGHLAEGIKSYESGAWSSANASFRTFLQSLFDELAIGRFPVEAERTDSGGARRVLLHTKAFLSNEENELLKSLFKYLHTEGPHPGLSEEFVARMRRYLVEVIALYFIEKFEKMARC